MEPIYELVELLKFLGLEDVVKNAWTFEKVVAKAIETKEQQDFFIGEDKYRVDPDGKVYNKNGECVIDFSDLLNEMKEQTNKTKKSVGK